REDFEKAIHTTAPERCQAQVEELTQSTQELNQLTKALAAKMGADAPGLIGVRQALEDCQKLVQHIAGIRGPVVAGKADAPAGQSAPASGATSSGVVSSRQEAYRQLELAAAALKQIEPHSPIPYLIQRAVELGRLPFPEMIKALVRDAKVLEELNREL